MVRVKERFGGAAFYNLLSAFAHAQEWSVIASTHSDERPAPGVSDARLFIAVKTMKAAVDDLEAYSPA